MIKKIKKYKYGGYIAAGFLLVVAFIFASSIYIRVKGQISCIGDQVSIKRETDYNWFFDRCVIDSGRKDSEGNIIWVRSDNDRGFGE